MSADQKRGKSEPRVHLWHDDVRPVPDGWQWARTNAEAKAILATGRVVEVSLDHDMGREDDGMKLVEWMIETSHVPPKITIHSWNPDGARRMKLALLRAGHDALAIPYTKPGTNTRAPWNDPEVEWRCEKHPDKSFPHDDCVGPGEHYPENLYPRGSFDASRWDLGEAFHGLGNAVMATWPGRALEVFAAWLARKLRN